MSKPSFHLGASTNPFEADSHFVRTIFGVVLLQPLLVPLLLLSEDRDRRRCRRSRVRRPRDVRVLGSRWSRTSPSRAPALNLDVGVGRVVTAGATGTGRRRRQLRQIALLVLSELVEAAGSSGQFKLKLDSEYYCPCCWRIYLSLVCFGSGAFFAFPLVDLPGRPRSSSRIVTAMLLYTSIIIFAFI